MTSLLAKLRRASGPDIALAAEAVGALAISAFVVAIIPFRRIAAFAGKAPVRSAPPPDEQARLIARVKWAIGAGARRSPWRAMCFEQGLAAQWMLRRRGVPATLYYGVAQRPEEGLKAHVWVRVGVAPVVGCGVSAQFAELARFPADGARAAGQSALAAD
ncbi:MAG: lasso peptide biosynthesis B2 protein [Pseudomonadota bacterium]